MPPKPPTIKSADGKTNVMTWDGGNDHEMINDEHELLAKIFVTKVAELVSHCSLMVSKDHVFPARNGSDSIERQVEIRKMLGSCLDFLSAVACAEDYQIKNRATLRTDDRKERGMTRVQTIHDKVKLAEIRKAGGFEPPAKPEPPKPEDKPAEDKKLARFKNLDFND